MWHCEKIPPHCFVIILGGNGGKINVTLTVRLGREDEES